MYPSITITSLPKSPANKKCDSLARHPNKSIQPIAKILASSLLTKIALLKINNLTKIAIKASYS
jgi:hypothetical protein